MKTFFKLTSSYDSLPMSVVAVYPDSVRPRGMIQLSHGMRGCKERFIPFMEYMASNGYLCVANDHRGHGGSVLSSEDLGYMYEGGWNALVRDMRTISEWALEEYPDLPLFLVGHSMGSLASRIYAYEYGDMLSGLFVIGSPSYNVLSSVGRTFTGLLCRAGFSRKRLRFMQKMVSWRYNRRFRSEGSEAWTCSDPFVRKAFSENPLCSYDFTANACFNLLCMMRETYASRRGPVSGLSVPVAFLSGGDDPCMISQRALRNAVDSMKSLGYGSVYLHVYPGMRHEILNESGKEIVWDDILHYIGLWTDAW